MLDINLFRKDKGGNPDLIRESEKRRNGDVTRIDRVIALDEEWIKRASLFFFASCSLDNVPSIVYSSLRRGPGEQKDQRAQQDARGSLQGEGECR